MALSETNEIKICQILNITLPVLSQQLDLMTLTSTAQTAIEAQITLWDAGAATNYTAIEPMERNFGARISPTSARNAIRQRIAILLERPDWASSGSRLVRC